MNISERSKLSKYYQPMKCSCGSTKNLCFNDYSENILCQDCVNELALQEEEEARELEGYYTENSYDYLLQERNA